MRRARSLLIALLTVALLSGCIGPFAPSSEPDASGGVQLSRDDLESAGIVVVADEEDAPADGTALTLTAVQADRIVAEAAVLALLVQDLMTAALQDDSFTESDPTDGAGGATVDVPPGPSIQPASHAVVNAPCSAVQNFIQSTIQSLFDVLRVIPGAVTKICELGIFGTILAAILNQAIGLAQGVVEGLVATITAPVLNAIRIGLTGLGTATLVLSYFTNERLVVKPGPSNHTEFGVQPAPGNKGTFTATTKSLTDQWPKALVDCAKASGAEIPPLIRAGDPSDWTVTTGATSSRSTRGAPPSSQTSAP